MKLCALALASLIAVPAFADGSGSPTPIDPTPVTPAAPVTIQKNTLTYVRSIYTSSQGGGVEVFAAVGGKVDFTGVGPVYVTLTNGDQTYTSLTDPNGVYSFTVWADGNDVQTTAWVAGTPQNAPHSANAVATWNRPFSSK